MTKELERTVEEKNDEMRELKKWHKTRETQRNKPRLNRRRKKRPDCKRRKFELESNFLAFTAHLITHFPDT